MFRYVIAALAMAGLVACNEYGANSTNPNGQQMNGSAQQAGYRDATPDTQLAAYAASHAYPKDAQVRNDLQAAALVNRENNTLRIFNFSTNPLRNVDVWINQTFIAQVPAIASQSSVTLPLDRFYDGGGHAMTSVDSSVRTVQLLVGNELYNLLGPAME